MPRRDDASPTSAPLLRTASFPARTALALVAVAALSILPVRTPAPGPFGSAAAGAPLAPTTGTALAWPGPAGAVAQQEASRQRADALPDPQQALARYDSLVEASLEAWRVPGAAVTVVVEGEVVLAEGFGVRDRTTGEPVTSRTLFPIGSASKAFTSLLVADLVEAGELAWDHPVHDALPGFRLHDDYATLHATPVDLLAHRTGLPRHDFAWVAAGPSPGFSRDAAMEKLRHFRPSEGFRSTFQYNNWMYMAAGRMAGRVAGGTWEQAVRRRLLDPLGMDRTTFRVDSMTAEPDHSTGYRTDYTGPDGEALEEPVVERADYFDPGPLGPAGSLISTAEEMAAWLELHTTGGELDGRRVVPGAAVEATHTPRIAVHGQLEQVLRQPELSAPTYGLGWFVQHYRGHRLVHHGGNINGFSSMVGILPEQDIGVSILTNNGTSALPYALLFGTLDRLLDLEARDWNERYRGVMEKMLEALRSSSPDTASAGGSPDHQPASYAGRYEHPGYGEIVVREASGPMGGNPGDDPDAVGDGPGDGDSGPAGLEAIYHGQTFPLEHRAHDVFVAKAEGPPLGELDPTLHFRTDARGEIASVALPLEPQLDDPILFEKVPEKTTADIPRSRLESYAGAYTVAGMTLEVRLRDDGTLVLDQPGQPTLELRPAGEDSFRVAREGVEARVEFVRGDEEVTGIVLRQGGRTFRGEKKAGGDGGGDSGDGGG